MCNRWDVIQHHAVDVANVTIWVASRRLLLGLEHCMLFWIVWGLIPGLRLDCFLLGLRYNATTIVSGRCSLINILRQEVGTLWNEEARIVQRLIESLVNWLVHALVQLWFIHCLVILAYLLLKWHLVVFQRVFGHIDLILYCFELVGLGHGLLLIGSSSGHVVALLISFQNGLQITLKSSWNCLIIIIYALI